MCKNEIKYRYINKSWIILALLLSCNIAFPQFHSENNTITKIPSAVLDKIKNNISLQRKQEPGDNLATLMPSHLLFRDKNLMFYDSLKSKASKNRLTKTLYSYLIVNTDTLYKKRFTGTSEANYINYSGKKIRRITIRRLNVFGADINNPLLDKSNKIENILNKTHFNTTENIVRKNLLFSEGDNISALLLSDNERILRQLPYIDDARIVVIPISDEEADIVVLTKDVYSLGAAFDYRGLNKGTLSVFEKNIFGIGHELGIDMPYDDTAPDSPGFGGHYIANNIAKSFINLNVYYLKGLGKQNYGFGISRKLVSATTKYAGGISIQQMYTTEDLDTLPVPVPLKYNLQDYWLSRSFLVNKESVTRIIIGARYTNNNVFDHPRISPESFYNLQKYRIYMGSVALSIQKYTKTNLIYSYGRTEDIPYGALLKFTTGREYNEFKLRTYLGGEASFGKSSNVLGYFYTYAGVGGYLNKDRTEQGVLSLKMNYFSNLINLGRSKMRNFVYLDYTRGFGRYSNEYLRFNTDNGFSGFKNDSVMGTQRLSVSLESVLFSPVNRYGFRFAFFGFTDFSFLSNIDQLLGNGHSLTSIGLGVRIRNDNLVLNTLQIRIGYFPNPPAYSRISYVTVSGVQLMQPQTFEPGPPAVIPYR